MGFRGVILLELGSRVLLVATNSTGGDHMRVPYRLLATVAVAFCGLIAKGSARAERGPGFGAWLSTASTGAPTQSVAIQFHAYLWLPWMTGDVMVKGRTLDVFARLQPISRRFQIPNAFLVEEITLKFFD